MNVTPHSRSWWKLHTLTWLAGILVVSALTGKNLEFWSIESSRGLIGWPKSFYEREDASAPFLVTPVREWRIGTLLIDALIFVVTVGGTLIIAERRQRQVGRFRLGMKWVLIVPAWIASIMAIVQNDMIHDYRPLRDSIAKMCDAVVGVAILLAWIAVFDLVSIAWNAAGRRRRTDLK